MKPIRSRFSLVFAILFIMLSGHAIATVASYLPYTYIYQNQNSDQNCYGRSMMIAEIGIPIASLMEAMFSPSFVFVQHIGFPEEYRNLNTLTTSPAIQWTYLDDSIDEKGISTFKTEIDMAAFSASNGFSKQGRQKTINYAKLALLALAKNAESISNNRFRLWLEFRNLPSQQGLDGTILVAKTNWPYNWQSQLLNAYQEELIGEYCR